MRQCGPQLVLLTCTRAEARIVASNLNGHTMLGAQSTMRYKLLQKKASLFLVCTRLS